MANQRPFKLTRRGVLATAGGAVACLALRPAHATPETMRAAMRAFAGEVEPRRGRVKLDLPPLVENGNSVTYTVTVDCPMTERDFVRRIAIFNEKNPQPNVAVFHLSPRNGRASVSSRMRLADSQVIVVLAELSDGSVWQGSAEVVVTLAACVEG